MKKTIFFVTFILFFYSTTAVAESSSPTIGAGSIIDIFNTVLLVIGLVILGWYQKSQIGTLKDELKSQKSLIESLKQYSDIIDVKKLKELVSFNEETIQRKKEFEIMTLQAEYLEKVKSDEMEKEKLLLKIEESSEVKEKLKADYKLMVEKFAQRVNYINRYRYLSVLSDKISIAKSSLLLNASVILFKNSIKDKKFEEYREEIKKSEDNIKDTLDCFGKVNISEFEEDLKIPEGFSDLDAIKFNSKINGICDSILEENDNIVDEIKLKLEQAKKDATAKNCAT